MTLRAFPLPLAGLVLVAGCMTGPIPVTAPPPRPPSSLHVGVLLPLTGANSGVGRDLRQAVELALGPDGPQPDVRDTGSTASGAVAATQAALAAGDVLIIGPLTQGETAAAAGVANGTPILAFTSDRQQARPGVWPLGITPQQQVARLLTALTAAGKTSVAAVLPDNAFGDALLDGLNRAGGAAATVRRYPNGRAAALEAAVRDIAGRPATTPVAAVPPAPAEDAVAPEPPPQPLPFNALMLAESGPTLRSVATRLPDYGIRIPEVQVVGPTTWARDAANTSSLTGAWYAAPDPAARTAFAAAYTARFNAPPPGLADIAYDAAQIARATAGSPLLLTRPAGFAGVDGPLALGTNGAVARGLAVFTVSPAGNRIVDPAPLSVVPGS